MTTVINCLIGKERNGKWAIVKSFKSYGKGKHKNSYYWRGLVRMLKKDGYIKDGFTYTEKKILFV
eukprot:UN15239